MATASWYADDSTTQGLWVGVYGSLGYYKMEGSGLTLVSSLPGTVSVSLTGAAGYAWASGLTSSSNPIALQRVATPTVADEDTWYSTSTSMAIAVTQSDTTERVYSFYMVDHDGGRAQTITITDTATSATLATRAYSGFTSGIWGRFKATGNVTVTLTSTGLYNAVVMGIMIDPSGAPPSAVAYPAALLIGA